MTHAFVSLPRRGHCPFRRAGGGRSCRRLVIIRPDQGIRPGHGRPEGLTRASRFFEQTSEAFDYTYPCLR